VLIEAGDEPRAEDVPVERHRGTQIVGAAADLMQVPQG
jgi:hypothetical protein